jgi:hypothetical protein
VFVSLRCDLGIEVAPTPPVRLARRENSARPRVVCHAFGTGKHFSPVLFAERGQTVVESWKIPLRRWKLYLIKELQELESATSQSENIFIEGLVSGVAPRPRTNRSS